MNKKEIFFWLFFNFTDCFLTQKEKKRKMEKEREEKERKKYFNEIFDIIESNVIIVKMFFIDVINKRANRANVFAMISVSI